jgi:hypothetical protein
MREVSKKRSPNRVHHHQTPATPSVRPGLLILTAAALVTLGLGGARLVRSAGPAKHPVESERVDRRTGAGLSQAIALRQRSIPKLVTAEPIGEAPRPSDRSLLDGLDDDGLAQIDRVDWSVRRAALAAAKLTDDEAARAEAVYAEAHRKWLAVEREGDRSTGALAPAALDELTLIDRRLTIGLMHALGTPKATTVRRIEGSEYQRLLHQRNAGAPGATLIAQVARRRLDQRHHRPQP